MSTPPLYESFAAVTMLVLGMLIVLARASQAMFDDPADTDAPADGDPADGPDVSRDAEPTRATDGSDVPATGAARIERHADTGQTPAERRADEVLDGNSDWDDAGGPWEPAADTETQWGENDAEADARRAREGTELEFSTGTLLANVALSQGLFGAVLVGATWLAEIPPAALGVRLGDPWNVGLPAVAFGAGFGAALYVGNELSTVIADATGVEYSEGLRESLAPDTLRGWAILLGGVLPVIAVFEELLFRAALVGAFAAGFGLSPWLLAALSTVAFAIGHGAQGPGGIAVTGLLGFALAAGFVLTESLLVVIVAHYVVNALEFGVHEGLGIEWV
ncbi:CPBP family intramembrane metalloprotease [Halobacteriales archaeon QS_1_67_19]|nr:MAG: CPBP family intramembrane metalloprotease [Halobacteriales archaeon QS_1_67_19]